MTLGQTTHPEQVGTGLLEIFRNLLHLQFPTRAEFVGCLETITTLQAAAAIALGIVYLFYGYKYFKVLVVINGVGIGALLGAYIGSLPGTPNTLLMGLAGGALLGALAWPAIKYAVGVMGALAGGLVGYAAWYALTTALGNEGLRQHAWAGGIIGMIVVGMITFIVFRASVMIFTALQGAIMTAGGITSLLLTQSINSSIKPTLIENDFLLIILFGIPAAVGFALQFATDTAAIKKKRKATEKPPV